MAPTKISRIVIFNLLMLIWQFVLTYNDQIWLEDLIASLVLQLKVCITFRVVQK